MGRGAPEDLPSLGVAVAQPRQRHWRDKSAGGSKARRVAERVPQIKLANICLDTRNQREDDEASRVAHPARARVPVSCISPWTDIHTMKYPRCARKRGLAKRIIKWS